MRLKSRIKTDIGTVETDVIICSLCLKRRVIDDAAGWLSVRLYGGWSSNLDFCSVEHLQVVIPLLPVKLGYNETSEFEVILTKKLKELGFA